MLREQCSVRHAGVMCARVHYSALAYAGVHGGIQRADWSERASHECSKIECYYVLASCWLTSNPLNWASNLLSQGITLVKKATQKDTPLCKILQSGILAAILLQCC